MRLRLAKKIARTQYGSHVWTWQQKRLARIRYVRWMTRDRARPDVWREWMRKWMEKQDLRRPALSLHRGAKTRVQQ